MNGALLFKEATLLRREPFVRGLLLVLVLLVVAGVLTGIQRAQVFDKERTSAQAIDRSVWMNQGERNPHSAAHFSRYAFRPDAALALLDPGTTDFSGLAIWMEAHYQDPAVFRRAEDSGELSRYAQLTPAFLVVTVAPLLVFLLLFGSVSGEREDGTLRQLLATGVDARSFFLAKLVAALRVTLGIYTLVFVPLAALSLFMSPASAGFDALLRSVMLYLNFAAYLAIFVLIGLGVSALFRTRQTAFIALVCIWVLSTVLLPRFATDLATRVYPQLDAREASTKLGKASGVYYADAERRDRIRSDLLERHGVNDVDDLPFNYNAYVLQVSEELSEPEFDRFYADLDARHAAQESVARSLSLLSPTLATARLSAGLSGTDRIHQRAFAGAAEAHRRAMIKLLNEDYMNNAGTAGAAYTADAELWAEFENLAYRPPSLGRVASAYAWDALLLVAWLTAAAWAAYLLVRRAVRGEGSAA